MIAIRVDTSSLSKELGAVAARVKDVRPVLKAWAAETGADIGVQWNKMTFARLYAGPADFRSGAAVWKKVPPMYTRKDGTAIPPWGGVPKAALSARFTKTGKPKKRVGVVKGRMRPSHRRVKAGDIVGKDTQTMLRQFVRSPKVHPSGRSISLVTVTAYAKYQNDLRPFNRLKKSDADRLVRIYKDFLISKMGRARG